MEDKGYFPLYLNLISTYCPYTYLKVTRSNNTPTSSSQWWKVPRSFFHSVQRHLPFREFIFRDDISTYATYLRSRACSHVFTERAGVETEIILEPVASGARGKRTLHPEPRLVVFLDLDPQNTRDPAHTPTRTHAYTHLSPGRILRNPIGDPLGVLLHPCIESGSSVPDLEIIPFWGALGALEPGYLSPFPPTDSKIPLL